MIDKHYKLDNFHPDEIHEPRHVGLIPDGTGRWAKNNNVDLSDAYIQGMHKICEFIEFCFENECEAVSVYLSSEQNFKRDELKIIRFCKAQSILCDDLLPSIVNKYSTRVKAVGERNYLPQFLSQSMGKIEKSSCGNDKTRVYLCVGYNPIKEMLRAVEKSAANENILQYLDVPEPLDLVIRTGNANLLSNFLPIQAGYARLYFIKKLFPNVKVSDIEDIFNKFKKLNRTFGT